jgi:hypothetical protein
LFARACEAPILPQLVPPGKRPFLDKTRSSLWQGSFDYVTRFNGDERLVLTITAWK